MGLVKHNKKLIAAVCCAALTLIGCVGCSKREKGADPPPGQQSWFKREDSSQQQSKFKQVTAMGSFLNAADKAADTVNHAKYRRITAEEAKAMMDGSAGAVVLDVRTEKEFLEGHIAKSVLLPLHELDGRAAGVLPDKGAAVLIYCRRGNRSRTAANKLLAAGYAEVYDFGGIDKWPFGLVEKQH